MKIVQEIGGNKAALELGIQIMHYPLINSLPL